MSAHKKFALKCICFIAALTACVMFVWEIITPKFFGNFDYSTTDTFMGFYEMKKNTIDVLFFGSSHAVTSVIPQELYNDYGIRSYNLSCEQQNLLTTYYWFREALKYQTPKVIAIDCYMLFDIGYGPLNAVEECNRKAFDYMKYSKLKVEALREMCKYEGRGSLLSYYLPNIRYHEHWKDLSKVDFKLKEMSRHYELKGYDVFCEHNDFEYEPFDVERSGNVDMVEMAPLMEEYLNNIIELCSQKNIEVILFKNPTIVQTEERHNRIKKYADEHDLMFLDFNDEKLYNEIGFDFNYDSSDYGHSNIWGAIKVTSYLGKILKDEYDIEAIYDEQWEDTKEYYEAVKSDCRLNSINDIDDYLSEVGTCGHSIIIAAAGDWTSNLRQSTIIALKNLGLKFDVQNGERCSYIAVIDNGNITEQKGTEEIRDRIYIGNTTEYCEIVSDGNDDGKSSITIDNIFSLNGNSGINIVVYNNYMMKVADAVSFDTCMEDNPAIR